METMITLAPVKGLLDPSAHWWGINILEQVETGEDVVIFPQGLAGIVAAGVGTQFADEMDWVVVFRANETMMRWIVSHSRIINSSLSLRMEVSGNFLHFMAFR